MVMSRLIGMTKALGNIRLVTRTWVLRSLIWRSVSSRKPNSVGSTSMRGMGNSRMICDIGMSELRVMSRNTLP